MRGTLVDSAPLLNCPNTMHRHSIDILVLSFKVAARVRIPLGVLSPSKVPAGGSSCRGKIRLLDIAGHATLVPA